MERFSFPVRVYWEDTDAGGVVYYASYLSFLERARSGWLRALGIDQVKLQRDERLQFVVVEAQHPLPSAGAASTTSSWCRWRSRHFAARRWRSRRDVRRGPDASELLISATIRAACIDADSLRPRPLPPAPDVAILKESP